VTWSEVSPCAFSEPRRNWRGRAPNGPDQAQDAEHGAPCASQVSVWAGLLRPNILGRPRICKVCSLRSARHASFPTGQDLLLARHTTTVTNLRDLVRAILSNVVPARGTPTNRDRSPSQVEDLASVVRLSAGWDVLAGKTSPE